MATRGGLLDAESRVWTCGECQRVEPACGMSAVTYITVRAFDQGWEPLCVDCKRWQDLSRRPLVGAD